MPNWSELIPKHRSKFIRVKCPDCSNEQVVFDSASTIVKCSVCDGVLAEPTGGRVKIHGEIVDILE